MPIRSPLDEGSLQCLAFSMALSPLFGCPLSDLAAECGSDRDCGDDELCLDARCTPTDEEDSQALACEEADECPWGDTCVDGTCEAGSEEPSDESAGDGDDGVGDSDRTPCLVTSDCLSGFCNDGFCDAPSADEDPGDEDPEESPGDDDDPTGVPLDDGSVGSSCTSDADCSPGQCGTDWPDGYCTIVLCSEQDCPVGSTCTDVGGAASLCLRECDPDPCRPSYACAPLPGGPSVCLPSCDEVGCAEGYACGADGVCEAEG
jgi:hypothetical protein